MKLKYDRNCSAFNWKDIVHSRRQTLRCSSTRHRCSHHFDALPPQQPGAAEAADSAGKIGAAELPPPFVRAVLDRAQSLADHRRAAVVPDQDSKRL